MTYKIVPVTSITIRRPDDFHLHLRDGDTLRAIATLSSDFKRAMVMPNLKPPITTVEAALSYRNRILEALPSGSDFEPLMTLYLTDETEPEEIARAKDSGFVKAVKYYPAGATTNSAAGVSDIKKVYPILERMQELGVPLLLHGEIPTGDPFDREQKFIDEVLVQLVADFPELKIVLEHITTSQAVAFVKAQGPQVAATITPQHLLLNREHMLAGGIRPHLYCMPILKREWHRMAILDAATSGNSKFFLGTDSAPHETRTKHAACGCAGCFTAPIALGLYAQAFDSVFALNRLEDFASRFGAEFYGLPLNEGTITLERNENPEYTIPASYSFGDVRHNLTEDLSRYGIDSGGAKNSVVPLFAGEIVKWTCY